MLSATAFSKDVTRTGYRIARGVEILPGGAALLTEENVLVVADMHLGVEASLEYEGLSIPRVQTKKIAGYMSRLIQSISPSKVVVAGDLKHNFSRNLIQEWQDVEKFVKDLSAKTSLEVVKGNHDNYLGYILREYGIPLRREVTISGVRILHGHSGKLMGGMTIMGHIHPAIRLRDSIGASVKDPCFLYNKMRRLLILPALSIVAYGTDVVGQACSSRMSPILSDDGLSGFVPILFSGKTALSFPTVGEMLGIGLAW